MRINSITTFLSLVIIVGGTFAAEAARNDPDRPDGRGNQVERTDKADRPDRPHREGDSENRRRPCYVVGATVVECPPKKKRPLVLPIKEDDCSCKPRAMIVGGQTRIVMDCYETRLFNGFNRTYVCNKPE